MQLKAHVVGVISDTHGLVRPEVLQVFKNVDLILHAGDIGGAEVLEQLREIAPVTPVRGNNDIGTWARGIPNEKLTEIGKVRIYLLHDLKQIKRSPNGADFQVVISGHSHRPLLEQRDGILFVNPGSAGPRRFKLPIAVAELKVRGAVVRARLIDL